MSCSSIADTVVGYLCRRSDIMSVHALVEHQMVRAGGEPRKFLDWRERPQAIVKHIGENFAKLSAKKESSWGSNGSNRYSICNIDEAALVKHIILSSPGQKTFIVMDIGAGKFQFGESIAEFINSLDDLPKDITVHILNLRGEQYKGDEVQVVGRCRIYRLGQFKIENLHDELRRKGLAQMIGQVDLAVSRMTYIHLADPVGTFQQTYNTLRPETGLFLGDSFFLAREENDSWAWSPESSDAEEIMAMNTRQMLIDTRAPLVVSPSLTQDFFILRRLDEFPCELPMRYGTIVHTKRSERHDFVFGTDTFCKFIRTPQPLDKKFKMAPFDAFFREMYLGSQSLYNRLKLGQLFQIPLPLESLYVTKKAKPKRLEAHDTLD